jgi:Tfp pilus assembly protein PilF
VVGNTASYSETLPVKFISAISAVLYHRWGHLDLAKKHYEISLQLDPMAAGTQENYGLLRRKLEQMQKKDG